MVSKRFWLLFGKYLLVQMQICMLYSGQMWYRQYTLDFDQREIDTNQDQIEGKKALARLLMNQMKGRYLH